MLGFTEDVGDQVEHLVTSEILYITNMLLFQEILLQVTGVRF